MECINATRRHRKSGQMWDPAFIADVGKRLVIQEPIVDPVDAIVGATPEA